MPNEGLALIIILGIALLDATLFLLNCLQFRRRKARAPSQALELAQDCQKVLRSVEPELANQVEFSPHVEIQKLGRFPWQRRICLVIRVKKIPAHKANPLKMTVRECAQKYIAFPAHRHLWARIEPNYLPSVAEKRHVV